MGIMIKCRSNIHDKNSTKEGELKYNIVRFSHYLCSGLILLEGELQWILNSLNSRAVAKKYSQKAVIEINRILKHII